MSEVKLFGKTIQLPSNNDVSHAPRGGADLVLLDCDGNSDHNNLSCSDGSVSPKSVHDKSNAAMDSKPDDGSLKDDEEQSEGSSSQETSLKKPDKILPCPRCNSMDTKFCYFNNYNVNQPRHFCKGCQRYWTAGGAIRNVPVGSGRRKAKSSPHPHPIVIPDSTNGTVYPTFMFGSDAPLCESVVSALNIAENSAHCAPNGFIQPEADKSPKKSFHGMSPQVPCYTATPWYPASYSPPGFPVSIYATPPFWGPCNVPWQAMSANNSSAGSSPSSPLGKHSREGDVFKSLSCDKEESGEESARKTKVLVPKTLRIDDPSEAAKSSIWATLGIRNGKAVDSINSVGVFGGFQAKGGETNSAAESSLVLQANPAAFSRSLRFHESAE